MLEPFDVVVCKYFSNKGLIQGMFVVLKLNCNGVFARCCKLTSQYNPDFLNNSVCLFQRTHSFLEKDSYAQLDVQQTLPVSQCVYVGHVHKGLRPKFKFALCRDLDETLDTLNKSIHCRYISPNLKK